jgi:6-pyruvoyl-tetrahydropterin synthase-like protein
LQYGLLQIPACDTNVSVISESQSKLAAMGYDTAYQPLTPTSELTGGKLMGVREALVLVVAALLLSLPMLIRGPMPAAHDTDEHHHFTAHFAEQFWGGEAYPRWLLNMNHGLGSPTFFVFPPLPSYVFAFLQPVGNALHFDAFNVSAFLCLLLSGIFAFLWISTMASRRIALVVACLYLLLPYHLSVDFYRRTALPECWALTWMPLVLYFTVQVVNKRRGAVLGLSVAYGLLILSHVISVLMFSVIPLVVSLTLTKRGERVRPVAAVIAGMVLGTGLSAFYLLPAFANAKYFPASRLGFDLAENLLVFGKGLLTGNSHKSGFVQSLSLSTADTALFIVFCGFMALRNSSASKKKQVLLWIAVCVIPLFMMSNASYGVWKAFPFLIDSIQFPWRLNIILCLAALPVAAFFLSGFSWRLSVERIATLGVMVLFIASWIVSFGKTVTRYSLPPSPYTTVNEFDGWYEAWRPAGMDDDSAMKASMGPQVRFLEGDGTATVLLWSPRRIELQTDCTVCGPAMIHQFYYPEWRAQLVSQSRPLAVTAALPEGLVEVQVPSGRQQILLEIPRGLSEHAGNWISAACALAIAGMLALSFINDPSKRRLGASRD